MKNYQEKAYCGFDCLTCPIYQATVKNDEKMQDVLKDVCSTANLPLNKDDMICYGCKKQTKFKNKMCNACFIRNCCISKKIENCGFCCDYPCDYIEKNLVEPNEGRTFMTELHDEEILKEVEKIVNKMTLKQKIGQLILPGFPTSTYDEHVKTLIEDYKVGNLIFFSRNFENAEQLKNLNILLYKKIEENTLAIPFMAIDQEGGVVTRLLRDVTFAPGAMTSAASYPNAALDCGKIIGEDMIRLGLNLDLAPCVDVNINFENPTMNVRCYGDDEKLISHHANLFVKGLKQFGVIGCVKHFPSYGACGVDAHLDLPYNNETLEKLNNVDFYPYYHLEDVKMIMSAHVIYQAIDDMPGTLSKKCYQLLKHDIGYRGLIVTDCLEMKAIADKYGVENAAVKAILAGADIVCICHTLERQIGALKAIEEAIDKNILPLNLINEKVKHILLVKQLTKRYLVKYFNTSKLELNQTSNLIAQNIVDESLVKIKGRIKLTDNTLVIAPLATVNTIVEDTFDERDIGKAIKRTWPKVEVLTMKNNDEFINEVEKIAINKEKILIFSYNAAILKWQMGLINELSKKYKVEVISLRGPFDYPNYHDIKKYMCVYEYTPNSIRTIIKYLKEEIEPNGELVIKL